MKKAMKVTVTPFITGALGTVIKGLIQGSEDFEISERVEIIQTTALLKSANTEKRPRDLLSLKLQWETIS